MYFILIQYLYPEVNQNEPICSKDDFDKIKNIYKERKEDIHNITNKIFFYYHIKNGEKIRYFNGFKDEEIIEYIEKMHIFFTKVDDEEYAYITKGMLKDINNNKEKIIENSNNYSDVIFNNNKKVIYPNEIIVNNNNNNHPNNFITNNSNVLRKNEILNNNNQVNGRKFSKVFFLIQIYGFYLKGEEYKGEDFDSYIKKIEKDNYKLNSDDLNVKFIIFRCFSLLLDKKIQYLQMKI